MVVEALPAVEIAISRRELPRRALAVVVGTPLTML